MPAQIKVTYKKSNKNSGERIEKLKESLRVYKLIFRGKRDELSQEELEKYAGISEEEARAQIKITKKELRELTGNTWKAYFQEEKRIKNLRRMIGIIPGRFNYGFDDETQGEDEDGK
ncbi:MAG: hypothetical protein M1464_00410 [Candidatus Thermoplasmatota archaeon]|jgi:hypothetical protein|nr:hypothetical protein [Candidatus Thermoplasmatota archaeon]